MKHGGGTEPLLRDADCATKESNPRPSACARRDNAKEKTDASEGRRAVLICLMDGLTHYTRTLEAVVGILNNGFAWVPNRRNLMSALVAGHDFSKREPQEFGMISFTDWSPPAPPRHRKEFGDFGIVVSREWGGVGTNPGSFTKPLISVC